MVTASGARLVIRGEADESIALDQEAWFVARACQAGVPVPEVAWNVSRSALVRGPLLRAEVIARLHPVQVGGFYRRYADGNFDFADAAAVQAADLANRLDNLHSLAEAGLTTAELRLAEGLLPEAAAARGDGPAVLCHGKLFTDHIFVAIVAVLGMARGRPCGQFRMLIGYTAHDVRVGKPTDAQGYLAGLKAVLASLAT